MRVSYEIVKVDDRIFFYDGEKYVLFDTGYIANPFGRNSISSNGMIADIAVNTKSKYDINSFIKLKMDDGSSVDAVFNPMDGYNCLLKGNVLTITDEEMQFENGKYFFPFTDGFVPIIEGSINGEKCRFFFDSGARMTMFGDRADAASEKIRSYTEWMALMHRSAVLDVFRMSLAFPNGFEYEGEGALVTDRIYQKSAKMMNIRAMLGIDIFNHYDMAIIACGAECGIMLFDK